MPTSETELSLPTYDDVRARIDRVTDDANRFCLQTVYLWAARISEVVGKSSLSDTKTTPRGPKGTDAELNSYKIGSEQYEIVVFKVRTAKREGLERRIGLPTQFEPWAKPLYNYFQSKKDSIVFPFTRQQMWTVSKTIFKGLKYPIEKYTITKKSELKKIKIPRHYRDFRLHALRHLRATELIEYYGFDGFNLATYGGWHYTTMARTSSIMERYLTLSWQSYIEKLCKPRR
jgi:hypothetical protein